jgi:ribosomal protein L14E/L6E/L27E
MTQPEPTIRPGQIVFSKRGRDKGLPFIVLSVAGEYAYLADGKLRRIKKPKKKKMKHIQLTNYREDLTAYNQRGLQDADIRKLLKEYSREEKSIV